MYIFWILILLAITLFIIFRFGLVAYLKHKIINGVPPKLYPLSQLEDDLRYNVFSHQQKRDFVHCFNDMNRPFNQGRATRSSNALEALHQLESNLQLHHHLLPDQLVFVEFQPNGTLNQMFDTNLAHKAFISALESSTIIFTSDDRSRTYYAITKKK